MCGHDQGGKEQFPAASSSLRRGAVCATDGPDRINPQERDLLVSLVRRLCLATPASPNYLEVPYPVLAKALEQERRSTGYVGAVRGLPELAPHLAWNNPSGDRATASFKQVSIIAVRVNGDDADGLAVVKVGGSDVLVPVSWQRSRHAPGSADSADKLVGIFERVSLSRKTKYPRRLFAMAADLASGLAARFGQATFVVSRGSDGCSQPDQIGVADLRRSAAGCQIVAVSRDHLWQSSTDRIPRRRVGPGPA
jgi:hypothetical protein